MTIREAPDVLVDISEDAYGLSLRDAARVIWERLPVILLVTVLLTGLVVGFNLVQTPTYEASTKVLIVEEREKDAADQPLASEVDGLEQLAVVMTEVVDSRRVAEATIQRSDVGITPNEFLKNLSAEQVSETPFIEVKYEDTSPGRAKRIANTIPEVLPDQVSDVNLGATGSITAKVFDPALAPDQPVSPNPLRNGFVALVLGLLLGVGLAFLLEYLDDSWHSPAEVEQISGVPTYALIPRYKLPPASKRSANPALPSGRSERSFLEGEAPNGKSVKH
jgi:capsular polysaccharide biosynthesis protein